MPVMCSSAMPVIHGAAFSADLWSFIFMTSSCSSLLFLASRAAVSLSCLSFSSVAASASFLASLSRSSCA
eukprot:13677558-Heterocapsa_arctica.AAC.1